MVRPFIGGNFCQNWGAICAAAMGPITLFHLGTGAGGLQAFCEHFEDAFHGWWDELGHAKLDEDTIKILVDGIADAHGDASQADLGWRRKRIPGGSSALAKLSIVVEIKQGCASRGYYCHLA